MWQEQYNSQTLIRGQCMFNQQTNRLTHLPDSLENILTAKQSLTLGIAQDNGWELYFVRQDNQGSMIAGIRHARDKTNGIIDKNGNFTANPVVRDRMYAHMSRSL